MHMFLFAGMATGRRSSDSHSHLGIPTAGASDMFKVSLGINIQPERGNGGEGTHQPGVTYMYIFLHIPLARTSHMVLPRCKGSWEI